MHPTLRRAVFAALLIAVSAPVALASGFHIYEQDAKASGQAVAFVARADDASAIYYNPAAMTLFDHPVVAAGLSAVFLGETTFDSGVTGKRWDMNNHTVAIGHLYYGARVPGTGFAWGLSYTNPFGLQTDWSTPGFDGRYWAVKTNLRTHMLNLNGAFELGSGWSAALGIDYVRAEIVDFSRRVPVAIQVPIPDETAQLASTTIRFEPLANFYGSGDKFSYNAALHWNDKDWAFGLTYRHGFDIVADGFIAFYDVPTNLGVGSFFPYAQASGTIKLPPTYAAAFAYTGLPKWQFEFDIHRVMWSNFDNIPVSVPAEQGASHSQVSNEDWTNTTSYRLGASFDLAEKHQVRAGIYKEDSPIPNSTLRPSIPDADRWGYTAGYGFHTGPWGIDVYYMHIKLDDVTVGPGDINLAEAVPLGTYKSKIDLAGVTGSYKF